MKDGVRELTVHGPRGSVLAMHCPLEGGDTDAALALVALALVSLERMTGQVLVEQVALVVAAARRVEVR